MRALTHTEDRVLTHLRDKSGALLQDDDGTQWGGLYLPAAIPPEMLANVFYAVLGSLARKGLYRSTGSSRGLVRLTD